MAGLCERGNEPSGSLKAISVGLKPDGLWRVLGINPFDLITWLGFSEVFPDQKTNAGCHNPGDPRNETVRLTGFLEFEKDAATLLPRGFDGSLTILLNESCDWLLTGEDKISVTVSRVDGIGNCESIFGDASPEIRNAIIVEENPDRNQDLRLT
ncbi:hypothetical protein ANN_00462 [Periplaneta americana]|uniref:Per a allergen n=1 Tax=Periplaneta americana TaxID=6978 RepID=A0ABQ8TQZ6_PERAM|nr:hypothetical protein ANN_00462 [Periplaneta americana]